MSFIPDLVMEHILYPNCIKNWEIMCPLLTLHEKRRKAGIVMPPWAPLTPKFVLSLFSWYLSLLVWLPYENCCILAIFISWISSLLFLTLTCLQRKAAIKSWTVRDQEKSQQSSLSAIIIVNTQIIKNLKSRNLNIN